MAAQVAVESIGEYLRQDPDMQVYLIILGSKGVFLDDELLSNIYKIESLNYEVGEPSEKPLGPRIADQMAARRISTNELAAMSNLTAREMRDILYGADVNHPTLLAIAIGLELDRPERADLLSTLGAWPEQDKRLQLASFFLEQGKSDIHKINLNNFALDFESLP
jgi:hypothetical protein